MKRILIFILGIVLGANSAFAQTVPATGQSLSNGCGLPQTNCTSDIASSQAYLTNTSGTPAAVATGTQINVSSNFDVNLQGTGQQTYPLPAVITPATAYPTPASATALTARYNIVAASGPTAMFQLFPQGATLASNVRGFGIFNQSANPVAMVPYPLDTFNASAAATPYSCATLKYCECLKLTATNWGCTSQ